MTQSKLQSRCEQFFDLTDIIDFLYIINIYLPTVSEQMKAQ